VIIEPSSGDTNGESSLAEFDTLRRLLVGPEQSRIEELSDEIESKQVTAEDLADKLPEAIALRAGRDDHLGRALGPTFETAMRESIRRHPDEMAAAIFPVLGPAIRKSIAETMAALVRSINTAVEQSLSINGLKWRIESWRTGVPYPEIVIKHALVYRVEQAFLIHTETGILLEHVSAPDVNVADADLISGMMSAIQDFVHDSFRPAEGGRLRTFSVGEHTVQVEAGPRALLALVIRGQAPDTLLQKQQDTLETIHLEFANQLAEFSGDSVEFAAARPLLESCLETVVSTDNAGEKGRLVWMKWALPVFLIAAVIAGFWIRSNMRWNRSLAALRAEPGIVVVDASRGWSNWNISGLKDPIARQPEAVISSSGISSPPIVGRWEPYLSLDPSLVALRARHSLDSLTSFIDNERIMFDAGSAELNPGALATLAGIVGNVSRLDAAAAASGGNVKLQLTGRTDPSGADETNAALAERRVDAVAKWLSSIGIDPSRLVRNPVATSSPLEAGDPAERARINRSVSFKVQATTAQATPGGQQ
jgi:outer membrane protein OmpA-like peptidoglycan-associated protein